MWLESFEDQFRSICNEWVGVGAWGRGERTAAWQPHGGRSDSHSTLDAAGM